MQFDHPIATPPQCEAHSTPRIEPAGDLMGPSSWALRFRWTPDGTLTRALILARLDNRLSRTASSYSNDLTHAHLRGTHRHLQGRDASPFAADKPFAV